MLESIVSTLLTKYLGEYIEGVDTKSLNISVWSGTRWCVDFLYNFLGKVELKDLKLKRSAFESLDIPIVVLQGYIGKLYLNVPWASIQSSPVIAEVSDIFLVVVPKKNVPVCFLQNITCQ